MMGTVRATIGMERTPTERAVAALNASNPGDHPPRQAAGGIGLGEGDLGSMLAVSAPLDQVEAFLAKSGLELVLANRTREKADGLAGRFCHIGHLQSAAFSDLERLSPFDLVLNATSAGHQGKLPTLTATLFAPASVCYDLNYGMAHEVLAQWCAEHGIACHDGLGMLVEQAAESFLLWTGQRPDTLPVIEALKPGAQR